MNRDARDAFAEATVLIVEGNPDISEMQPVRQRLDGHNRRRRRPRSSTRPAADADGGQMRDDCPEPVELVLYVSAHAIGSSQALAKIKRVLSRFASSRVKLTICDLSKNPGDGARDSVTFTPTLVKRSPGPRTFILGHISSPELVAATLEACGEDAI